jgi:hypothetical protein
MSYSFVCRLFEKIDINKDGLITFDEFKFYALEKPEYSRILLTYHELKASQNSKKNEDDQLFISDDVGSKESQNT